ncbi:MAG: hypothetical protein CMP49_03925 [Flavobacteriales bacterium]|nr:hypothetical protein [Flavobacteriales bacterium]|tara:strand:- start:7734 stop:7967 length:234 start_codon:yes stop_codon:yes gene_type:complete
MIENKKIKDGLKMILIAVTSAFLGPVLFVLGFGNNSITNLIHYILIGVGVLLMINAIVFGILAIKKILSGFFEKTNE